MIVLFLFAAAMHWEEEMIGFQWCYGQGKYQRKIWHCSEILPYSIRLF